MLLDCKCGFLKSAYHFSGENRELVFSIARNNGSFWNHYWNLTVKSELPQGQDTLCQQHLALIPHTLV